MPAKVKLKKGYFDDCQLLLNNLFVPVLLEQNGAVPDHFLSLLQVRLPTPFKIKPRSHLYSTVVLQIRSRLEYSKLPLSGFGKEGHLATAKNGMKTKQ